MTFSTIGNILDKNLKAKSGLAQQVQTALICDEFNKIIQHKWPNLTNKAKALYFKNNILTIASLSSVMAQEIKLHEKEILDKLNEKFPDSVLNIRYIV